MPVCPHSIQGRALQSHLPCPAQSPSGGHPTHTWQWSSVKQIEIYGDGDSAVQCSSYLVKINKIIHFESLLLPMYNVIYIYISCPRLSQSSQCCIYCNLIRRLSLKCSIPAFETTQGEKDMERLVIIKCGKHYPSFNAWIPVPIFCRDLSKLET